MAKPKIIPHDLLRNSFKTKRVVNSGFKMSFMATPCRRAVFQQRNFLFRSKFLSTTSPCRSPAAEIASSSSAPPPPPLTNDARITRIVDDISTLTLLQAADLVSALKTRLNITEIAMPTGGGGSSVAAVAPAEEEAAPAEEKKEKTIFNVHLESFEAGAKPKIIREVKALVPNLTLIEAKKFVESLPKVLKENLPKDDAEKLQKAFQALGAVVKID